MPKLSQQLAQKEIGERPTRTERVGEKQAREREIRNRARFERLKKRAEGLQQTEFSEIKNVEEYEQKYSTLSTELQPFFQTPTEVKQTEVEQINITKVEVKERQTYADQKLQEDAQRLKLAEERFTENRRWAQNKRGTTSRYDGEWYQKYIDRKRERLRDEENRYEEKEKYWSAYKRGLNEGIQQLDQGKNLNYNSIHNYAHELGHYEEEKKRARNEQREVEYKQIQKIESLKAQGYKPFVVQASYKGQPKSVELLYYHVGKGDYQTIQKYQVSGKVDVTKLEQLGFTKPQERTISFAGKEFKFTSRVPIYKTKTGEVVTPYQKTGFTEAQLIKKSQDIEWQERKKDIGVTIPYKILAGASLPFGYGGQQTVSDQPISQLISKKDYYRDPKKLNLFGIKSGFKWIDERVHFDLKLVGTTIPKLDIITFGKLEEPTKVEAFIEAKGEKRLGGLSAKVEELAVGKENIGVLETKYQEKYDVAFEQKYMKKLIYEEITFEKAVKEFEKGEEAKILQKEYAIDYKQLQTDIPFWKKTSLGVAQTGIGLTSFGLKAVKTPTRLVATVGAVYGGVKVLGAIPKSVSYGVSGGLFAYGTYKFLDPTSTYVESGGGLVTALVSGAFLGHGIYKHLRSPVVKTLKIKPPKISLKASETIGKDLKIITKKGTIQKVIFESQKLSQTAIAGRRTIVTTKGRLLLEKYTKIKIDPIYKGVPTQQLGKAYTLRSLRDTSVYKTPSAYQKTLKKLIDYKYTPAQARATLRSYSPRVIDQYLKKGIISVKGKKAVGEFVYLKKQPVFDVDKALGIKTRGARTIKDIYKVERKLVDLGKKSFVLEEKTRLSLHLKRGASPFDFKEMDLTRGIIFGKTTGLKKGYELKDLIRAGKVDLKVFEKATYRDLYGVSISKRMLPSEKIIRINDVRTKLILKTIDIRKLIKPFGIKKTPFAKTFDTTAQVKKIIRQSQKSSTVNVEKVIAKLEQTPTKVRSQFYGKGQYERTIGGLDLQQGLKAGVLPEQVKVTALKDLIKVKQLDTLTGVNLAQLSTVGLITKTKTATKLKTDLLIKSDLKSLLKTKSLLKQVQVPALKQQPALKQALKLKLGLKTISPTITTFTLKTPTIPTIRPPTYTPPIIPPFLLKGRVEKKLLKKKKFGQEFAYLPDFTARALGLDPEIITGKQAQAKIKKILTGLEIRRGVRIK